MTELNSEVVDVLKQLQQVVAQLSQLTQGATTGQVAGQRVDRTDNASTATKQDVGADELKDVIGGLQSARTLDTGSMVASGGMSYRAAIEAVNLQVIQGGALLSQLIISKASENVLGVNVTDIVEGVVTRAMAKKA